MQNEPGPATQGVRVDDDPDIAPARWLRSEAARSRRLRCSAGLVKEGLDGTSAGKRQVTRAADPFPP